MSRSIICGPLLLCGASVVLSGCRRWSKFNQGAPGGSFSHSGLFMVSAMSRSAVQFQGAIKDNNLSPTWKGKALSQPRQASGKDLFSFARGKINIYIPVRSVLIEITLNPCLRVRQPFRRLIPYIPVLFAWLSTGIFLRPLSSAEGR